MVKRESLALLVILALAAVPALSAAAPPHCQVWSPTDTEYAAAHEAAMKEWQEDFGLFPPDRTSPDRETGAEVLSEYVSPLLDVKPGFEPAIGVELVWSTVCVP